MTIEMRKNRKMFMSTLSANYLGYVGAAVQMHVHMSNISQDYKLFLPRAARSQAVYII